MGYLNNSIVTIDAILTKKGRECMARNDGSFRITQFALSDDEIDYTLYNPEHEGGSNFYGEAIDSLPLLEAFSDESQIMKYKLVTLPRGTAKMPILNLGYTAISLKQGAQLAITPQTLNYLSKDQTFETSGYIATVADTRLLATFEGVGTNTEASQYSNRTQTLGSNVSKTVTGTQINLRASTVNALFGNSEKQLSTLTTTLTVVGIDSGARITIPLTITKATN